MATVEISNNGAILRITYTVTNNMSTSATYGTSTITINNLEARVTGGGTYYGAKPFYQIQLLKSNGSSIGTYYAFTGNAGSSPAFTLSGSYASFPEVSGYYTKNKAITVTRSAQSESFAFSVVNNGSTARYNHNNGSYYFNGSASFTISDCAYATPVSISSITGTSTDQEVSIVLSESLSNSFKCQLQYKFGTDTSYTNINSSSALITVSTTGTTTYKWIPTTAVFAPKLTTAMSGTCVIRCITYSGSTQVGITSNNFTLNLNNANNALNPTANFAFAPVWSGVHPDTANNKYVQGKTQIKTTITGAAGKFGATIKSYTYEGLDDSITSISATNTTKAYVGTTQITKTAIVTDSRGLTCSATVTINPVSYTAPTIDGANAYRSSISAKSSEITTAATLSPTYSLGDNTFQPILTITYSESGGTQQSTNNTIGILKNSSGATLSFSMYKSYTVTLTYSDQFGSSASKSFIIQSKSVGMHLRIGNDGVAFGKYSEHSKTLELPDGWRILIGDKNISSDNPRNLLDNSDFRNPVNQRGLQEYTSNGYSIDRWIFEKSGNVNARLVVQRVEAGFPEDRISLQVGSGGFADFYQNLENYDKMAGKRYTLAVNIKGVVYAQVFTMGNFAGGISLGNDGAVFYSTPNQHVLIRATTAPGFNMLWMALYEGEYTAETLPEYRCKGYGAELAECQRYYYRNWDGDMLPQKLAGLYAPKAGRTTSVVFPVTMRETPSITLYNPISGNKNCVGDWTTDEDVSASALYVTKHHFTISGDVEASKMYEYLYEATADL